MLEILGVGVATVQDLGRPGYAHLGVPHSGALDQPALRLANRLVSNPESDACLELAFGGAVIRPDRSVCCAVTGAAATITIDGRPAPYAAPFELPAGATLRIGRPERGVRSYLAVAGGITTAPVLGSRSTDTLSGLGGEPLRPGDRLPLGSVEREPVPFDFAPVSMPSSEIRLRVRFGPRDDWFVQPEVLICAPYAVGDGNRIGVRLVGQPLVRSVAAELPSEGLLAGAVQVPADGQPLIFLADHPTTGGYPVVAVVHPADLPLVAQAAPGVTLRFVPA